MINLELARQQALRRASDISDLVAKLKAYVEDEDTPVVNPKGRDPRRDDD